MVRRPATRRGTSCFRDRARPSRAARHLRRLRRPAAGHRRDGLRRRVSAADPPDRPHVPQRPQQHGGRRSGRCRQPLGDRRHGGRPHGDSSAARHARRLPALVAAARRARHGDRARHRLSVLARSSLGRRASGVVTSSPGRHDSVRGESAEEVSGHLPVRLRIDRLAGAVGGAARVFIFWIDAGRPHLPRRQSAHQGVCRSGSGASPDHKRRLPRRDLSRGGVHPAQGDVPLAKAGFTQSYTYFTWRNTKDELTEYFEELAPARVRDFFRPNLWPNTPDILPEHLQKGGRPAFIARLVLAATLAPNYGIYGPAFELCENEPREPGSEEYLRHREVRDPPAGTSNAVQPAAVADRAVNRIRARTSRAAERRHSALPRRRTTRSCSATARPRRTSTESILSRASISTRRHPTGGVDRLDLGRLAARPASGRSRSTICSTDRRYRLARTAQLRRARSPAGDAGPRPAD